MIKLYRKTFIISCNTSIIAFVLSVLFESFRGRVSGLSFFENYAIGIACSGALVATTTFLQFQAEYNQKLHPLAVAVADLVLFLYSAILYENDPSAFEREFDSSAYGRINSALRKACKDNYLISICRKCQKASENLCIFLDLLCLKYIREKSETEAVKEITDSKIVIELIDLSLKAFPDCDEKEEIREIKEKLKRLIDERG